jgi:hypothetical protein
LLAPTAGHATGATRVEINGKHCNALGEERRQLPPRTGARRPAISQGRLRQAVRRCCCGAAGSISTSAAPPRQPDRGAGFAGEEHSIMLRAAIAGPIVVAAIADYLNEQ